MVIVSKIAWHVQVSVFRELIVTAVCSRTRLKATYPVKRLVL
jgi:hypothetical protein